MATAAKTTNPDKGRRGKKEMQDLQAALKPDQPVFPYPDDLLDQFKPLWLEMVNTKTVDYWTRGDIPLLKMYCRCAHDVERLSEEIRAEGEVILNAKDNPVVNPKIVIRGFSEARLLSLCTKLRMQPSSRVDPGTEKNHDSRKKKAQSAAQKIGDGMDGNDGDDLLAGAGCMLM